MRIVIDTNVLISGVFFGGMPRRVLDAVMDEKIIAVASEEIIEEYVSISRYFMESGKGRFDRQLLSALINRLERIEVHSDIRFSRDPDDDKFLSCALDAKAICIVSGDKDLLVLNRYQDIEIITAKVFCERFL